jgi:hypothetical protein
MKGFFFALFLFGFISFIEGTRYFKASTPDSGPLPRANFGLTAGDNDNHFYLFGGVIEDYNVPSYPIFNDLWRFDYTGGSNKEGAWTQIFYDGNGPSVRAYSQLSLVIKGNGKKVLALYGGTVYDIFGNNFPSTDYFWVYDIEENTWQELTNVGGPNPGQRAGHKSFVLGSKFYVYGGLDPLFVTKNDLWYFDFDTETWTQVTPSTSVAPTPTFNPVGDILVNNQNEPIFVVYGGETITFVFFPFFQVIFGENRETFAFDFGTNSWTNLTNSNLIEPQRTETAAVASRNRKNLLLYGGDIPGGEPGCGSFFSQITIDDTWRFTLKTNRWRKLNIAPVKRPPELKKHGMVQIGNLAFLVGGYSFVCENDVGPGPVYNNDLYFTINVA